MLKNEAVADKMLSRKKNYCIRPLKINIFNKKKYEKVWPLEAKYEEIRGYSRLLHNTICTESVV